MKEGTEVRCGTCGHGLRLAVSDMKWFEVGDLGRGASAPERLPSMHKALGSITRRSYTLTQCLELKRDLRGPESPLVTGMGQLGDISSFSP